jgi:hypothetical protein
MFCLSAQEVASNIIWQDIAELFERFARCTGETSPEQIRRGAIDSMLQIWGLQDAETVHQVAVTEIIETAIDKVCVIRIVCGEAPKGLQSRVLDEIGHWAKDIGCARVRFVGRKGWFRRYPRFRPTAAVGEWVLT